MFETVEEFATVSELNSNEISALQVIVADKSLMAKAAELENCYFETPADKRAEINFNRTDGGDHSRVRFGAAFLAARRVPGFFAAHGFPESVMLESMTDLKVWLRNEMRHRDVCGLSFRALIWQFMLYEASVTRHGRLECNTDHTYNREILKDPAGNILLSPGDKVINLHIPEDGPMLPESCLESMRRMAKFFAEYLPQTDWKGFICESWLLDTQLRPMLPEKSNIIKFQDLGQHYFIREDRDAVFRIFGTPDADPDSVKNPTSLQRKAAEFIRSGGKFVEEGMFIHKNILD